MAAAIAAAKLEIPIAQVEAGLRSFDRAMPEEINRILTDSISDMLLVSDPIGVDHLLREGHRDENIHLVGNLMIDTLMHSLEQTKQLPILEDLGLAPAGYGLVMFHRPSNVDERETLEANRRRRRLLPRLRVRRSRHAQGLGQVRLPSGIQLGQVALDL